VCLLLTMTASNLPLISIQGIKRLSALVAIPINQVPLQTMIHLILQRLLALKALSLLILQIIQPLPKEQLFRLSLFLPLSHSTANQLSKVNKPPPFLPKFLQFLSSPRIHSTQHPTMTYQPSLLLLISLVTCRRIISAYPKQLLAQ